MMLLGCLQVETKSFFCRIWTGVAKKLHSPSFISCGGLGFRSVRVFYIIIHMDVN